MNTKLKNILGTIVLSILIASCSNKPDDKIVKEIIADFEKQESMKFQNVLVSPCGVFKSIKIPKKFRYGFFPTDQYLNQLFMQQKDILDAYSLKNIITMEMVNEGSGVNNDGIPVNTKDYNIHLGQIGESIKLGETADEYVLPMLDYNNVELLGNKNRGTDTIIYFYKLNELPTYQILKEKCSNRNDNYLVKNDSSVIVIIKQGDKWIKE